MGPPKVRIHSKPNAGKLKQLPKPVPVASTSQTPETTEGDVDPQEKFEIELAWCIQRLEESLNSGKLNQKQSEDTMKTIKVLRSGNQPIIRKRQLMRTTFGDYRAKMIEDEKKYALDPRTFKFEKPSSGSQSFFVKKSAFAQGGNGFKFNFAIDEEAMTETRNGNETNGSTEFHFKPSSNTFRFNFNVEEEKME